MPTARKILVIQSKEKTDPLFAESLASQVHVVRAYNGESGLALADLERPDVILLDLCLPKMSGLDICRNLRTNASTRDILITAIGAEGDESLRTEAFLAGADGFIHSPVNIAELLARVGSKIRRLNERDGLSEVVEYGNLRLELRKLEAQVCRKRVKLSFLEFTLLTYLVQNADRTLSRDQILKNVWKDEAISVRTIDTHIVSLRKRLQGFDHAIVSVYGEGYSLKPKYSTTA